MKQVYETSVAIPDGIKCKFSGILLECSKGNTQLSKIFETPGLILSIDEKEILIKCNKSNRKSLANAHSYVSHIKNMFQGLKERFVYEMEICNVHFPMTVKI